MISSDDDGEDDESTAIIDGKSGASASPKKVSKQKLEKPSKKLRKIPSSNDIAAKIKKKKLSRKFVVQYKRWQTV